MENKQCGMNHYYMPRMMNRSGHCPGNGQASCRAAAVPAPAPVEYTPDGQPMVLALAYVPMQVLNTLYDPEEGFCQGTIFPELNKPWLVGGVNCG